MVTHRRALCGFKLVKIRRSKFLSNRFEIRLHFISSLQLTDELCEHMNLQLVATLFITSLPTVQSGTLVLSHSAHVHVIPTVSRRFQLSAVCSGTVLPVCIHTPISPRTPMEASSSAGAHLRFPGCTLVLLSLHELLLSFFHLTCRFLSSSVSVHDCWTTADSRY